MFFGGAGAGVKSFSDRSGPDHLDRKKGRPVAVVAPTVVVSRTHHCANERSATLKTVI
jgi:hypothetical protein